MTNAVVDVGVVLAVAPGVGVPGVSVLAAVGVVDAVAVAAGVWVVVAVAELVAVGVG